MLEFDRLSLTDIIRLQNELSATLARRFERLQAVAFSDIVESTAYFTRFGDEAGRRLQQHHLDLLEGALGQVGGRIVDTAADGAFLCFPDVATGVQALAAFHDLRADANAKLGDEHHLVTRAALHWGPVLTDGVIVTGESVNLCARVTAAAAPETLLVTRAAFLELPGPTRLHCRALPPLTLSGLAGPVELFDLPWRDPSRFPSRVRIEETGTEVALPEQPVITFGRLRGVDGAPGNDIVLELPDPARTHQISRWHFEVRREPPRLVLRTLSTQLTEVDGAVVPRGHERDLAVGTVVTLARVMTLRFLAPQTGDGDDTAAVPRPGG